MILVTGAAGFVGRHVVARLVAEGERPRCLVRDKAQAMSKLPVASVELIEGDTTKPETLEAAVAGVDTIIHAAFITAERKQGPGVNYQDTNVNGTRNLVESARRAGVTRIVEAGGLGTKSSRAGSYMEGRYLADQSIKQSGLAWSVLGPSIQFGEGSAFITGLADLIRKAPIVPMIGNGKRTFQPIWVEDVARCLIQMARQPERYDHRTIEVGGPEIYTYAQILDMLMASLGKRKLKAPGPMPFVALGALAMELTLRKPPITTAALGLFTFDNVATPDVVQREFGFAPKSFRAYLAERGV